jgi:methyl-accepting chemotaxis protein/hemerythrin
MPFIPWEDKFALGINEIDEQHKKMLSIINKLYDLFEDLKNNDQIEIDKVIKEVADYAIYHFATEEKYFTMFGYEKADEHVKIHNQYRAKIDDWRKKYEETRDEKIFFEISNFLHDWWIWHINNTDRDYVPFMKANKII